MPDLIFVSMEDWDEIWRRNQFICAELARRHPGNTILFVGLPRNVSHDLRHGRLGQWRQPVDRRVDGLGNLHTTRPLKLFPDTLTLGRKMNHWLFRRHVRREARRLGLRRPALWLNPHSAVHMAGRMGESAVVYDVTDDWISLTQRPRLRELVRRQDAQLCRRADAVIVCSRRLYEMKRDLTPKVHWIPNGVDAGHYRQVVDGEGPLPPVARQWPRPVLGYTGTIHPDRVDVGLVRDVARLWKGSVVLMGPNQLPADDAATLLACGNVFLPGPVAYEQIPRVMRAFDVCITPHRVTSFTESLNPIKLWEYLASGKPIVSTPVAGFRDYPNLIYIANTPEQFVAALRIALREPDEHPAKAVARRNAVMGHSWQSRVDLIERVIRTCRGGGDKSPVGHHHDKAV